MKKASEVSQTLKVAKSWQQQTGEVVFANIRPFFKTNQKNNSIIRKRPIYLREMNRSHTSKNRI